MRIPYTYGERRVDPETGEQSIYRSTHAPGQGGSSGAAISVLSNWPNPRGRKMQAGGEGKMGPRNSRLYSSQFMDRVNKSYEMLNPRSSPRWSSGTLGGAEYQQRQNDANWIAGRNEYLASLGDEEDGNADGWSNYRAQQEQNRLMATLKPMAPEQPQAIPEIAKAPLTNYGSGAGVMGVGASAPKFGEDKFYTNSLRSLLTDPSAFQKTPGFKAALDTGRQAIERSMAARGLGNSGNVLAELMKYGQGLASQEYGGQVDRLSRLSQYEQGNGDYWKNTRWGPRA